MSSCRLPGVDGDFNSMEIEEYHCGESIDSAKCVRKRKQHMVASSSQGKVKISRPNFLQPPFEEETRHVITETICPSSPQVAKADSSTGIPSGIPDEQTDATSITTSVTKVVISIDLQSNALVAVTDMSGYESDTIRHHVAIEPNLDQSTPKPIQQNGTSNEFKEHKTWTYNLGPLQIFGTLLLILIGLVIRQLQGPLHQAVCTISDDKYKALHGCFALGLLFIQIHVGAKITAPMRSSLPVEVRGRCSQFGKSLTSFVEFSSLVVNQDTILRFLQFTLWLLSKAYPLESVGRSALEQLSTELGTARFVTRLLGLPTALEALLHGTWTQESKLHPRTSQFFGDLAALGMIVYFPAEHMALLHWKASKWVEATAQSGAIWCAWSCRGWVAAIVSEIAQGILRWKELGQKLKAELVSPQKASSEFTADKVTSELTVGDALLQTKLQIVANALILLPALRDALIPEWKEINAWLSLDFANFLSWLESVVVLYQATV
mmetsp:Transcript_4205/g.5534  ORF Transcript_4205/g.5534 Transcript_4205/m.5534 type:complete len:493 (+) Transcript_4205:167-1645(+)